MGRVIKKSRIWAGLCLAACVSVSASAQPVSNDAQQTELAYRAGLGRAADISLLIDKGANPNGVSEQGVPLIIVAAGRKDDEALNAVQALVEGGADVNARDANGQTALYHAARNGSLEIVDYLLKHHIDYYSLDRNGDIARTIAFRAGHEDVVKHMDDFVRSQTIGAQAILQNSQLMTAEQMRLAQEDAAVREEEERRRAEEEAEKARLAQEAKMAEYRANLEKLDDKIYDISYHSCAFQYWSYVYAAHQTAEISDEEVKDKIDQHLAMVHDTSLEVMRMFDAQAGYVDQVIRPSKQAIYDQLNAMPSRTYRKENGVGGLEDVQKRCDRIARNWRVSGNPALQNLPVPEKATLPGTPPPQPAPKPRAQTPPPAAASQNGGKTLTFHPAPESGSAPQAYPENEITQKTGSAALKERNAQRAGQL